ncbi:MAG: hypothetical protein LBC81_02930 [Tannerellaceae bacterium]|nr:hypothetical protein [Tannerellaceae bacterium]
MNNQFSFKRVGLLMRLDFISYGREFVLGMSAIPLVWFTLMWLARHNSTSEMSEICFTLNGLLALITFSGHAARKMFKEKHAFMMTPALNEEKYASLIAEGLVYLLVSQIGFWLGSFLCKLCFPTVQIAAFQALFFNMNINIAITLFFCVALYFVAAVSVPKLWFIVAIVAPNLYVALHVFILFLLSNCSNFFAGAMINGNFGSSNSLEMTGGSDSIAHTMRILVNIYTPVIGISSIILFYVAYLKLKEKELK